jgi:hypothetical protein
MTMIEALLSLPVPGTPALVGGDIAAVLKRCPTKFAASLGSAWFLTDIGRHFLAQFRPGNPAPVTSATVRLVTQKNGEPQFDLLLDDGSASRLHRKDLQRTLQEMRAANPDVRIAYDFRPVRRDPLGSVEE